MSEREIERERVRERKGVRERVRDRKGERVRMIERGEFPNGEWKWGS